MPGSAGRAGAARLSGPWGWAACAGLVACVALAGPRAWAGGGVDLHALVEAANEGDVIELPAGTHDLDRPLVIDKRVALVGRGREQTVIRSVAEREGVMVHVRGVDGVRLSGFTLDGAGNERVSQGVQVSGGSGHRLEDLGIGDIPGSGAFGPHAIYATGGVSDSRFAGLVIRDIGRESAWGAGVRIGEGGRGNLIEGNDLAGLGRGGILTTRGSTDTVIRDNRVRDFGHAGPGLGIEVWGSGERVVIEDNTVDHWISVDGQRDVAVRRNRITGAREAERIGSYGLELVNSERIVMTDNVMEGGNHIGVSVSNRARKDLAYWARNRLHRSETWGAQVQGEQGGAHRMYFHRNEFTGTRADRSQYPGAGGHGFRFNGNAFQIVLDSNRIADNEGAGIQLGGGNLDRLSFVGNVVADNAGPAVTGSFDGDALLWAGNEASGNGGGDGGLESRGFGGPEAGELRVAIAAERRAGEPIAFELDGFDERRFTGVLWDLGHGIPRNGQRVEHVYDRPGRYRIAAIAWTREGRGVLVEAEAVVGE